MERKFVDEFRAVFVYGITTEVAVKKKRKKRKKKHLRHRNMEHVSRFHMLLIVTLEHHHVKNSYIFKHNTETE